MISRSLTTHCHCRLWHTRHLYAAQTVPFDWQQNLARNRDCTALQRSMRCKVLERAVWYCTVGDESTVWRHNWRHQQWNVIRTLASYWRLSVRLSVCLSVTSLTSSTVKRHHKVTEANCYGYWWTVTSLRGCTRCAENISPVHGWCNRTTATVWNIYMPHFRLHTDRHAHCDCLHTTVRSTRLKLRLLATVWSATLLASYRRPSVCPSVCL